MRHRVKVMKKYVWILSASLMLGACSSEQDDIATWMLTQEAGMKGVVEPLPPLKEFPAVEYIAMNYQSPFASTRLIPEKGKNSPDTDRPREPLEAYPIESLSMVGTIMKDGVKYGWIQVSGTFANDAWHRVKIGNYIGQNYGQITDIKETEITIREEVEDLRGDWTERENTLLLQQQEFIQ